MKTASVLLVALAWSGVAYCNEIHDAAGKGDLERVRVLLKDHPDLVFSKDKEATGKTFPSEPQPHYAWVNYESDDGGMTWHPPAWGVQSMPWN